MKETPVVAVYSFIAIVRSVIPMKHIIGSVITEQGPQPFVLHTQNGMFELGSYVEPDKAQRKLSVIQQQRFAQLIHERAGVSFAQVRIGQYYCTKCNQWVDAVHAGWNGTVCASCAPRPAEASGESEPSASALISEEAPPAEAPAVLEAEMPAEASAQDDFIDAVLLPNEGAMLEKAIRLAVDAHSGQLDKAGMPYILHPLRMMVRMQTPEEMMVAVLHDVVEDTRWTLETLRREGFSEVVIEGVDHMTRREGESYDAFVERAARHPLALRVKIADLEDNMDVRRLGPLTDKDRTRLARYQKAWHRLRTLAHSKISDFRITSRSLPW